ncbi:MAG: ATP-binding protein [Omnitrophica bacterium]|nr:ATP-binding protein [Candidatus Omnitrophota bacterium]
MIKESGSISEQLYRVKQSRYLLRVFLISSLISVIVILLAISLGIYRIYNDQILRDAQRDAVNFSLILFDQEKRALLSQDPKGRKEVRISENDYFGLDVRMKRYLRPLGIVKIKIFSQNKEIIYSTDPSIVGKIDNKNKELDKSLGGDVVSSLETKDKIWDFDGEERRDIDLVETYCPIADKNNNIIGSFEVHVDVTEDKAKIKEIMMSSVIIISIVLVCIFGILFLIMRYAIKTIDQLMEKETELAAKAAAKAAAVEVERKRAEELEKAYKELSETRDMLIQSEKLKAIGQLASGVAHEVRNPLEVIIQGADYLKNKLSSAQGDILEVVDMVRSSVKRADTIINSLLDFSRSKKLDLQLQDINSILESSLTLVGHSFKLENVEIVKEVKDNICKVSVDKNKIEQVFVNLFLNSLQAMSQGGKLTIKAYNMHLDQVGMGIGSRKEDSFKVGEPVVVVEIKDTGCGISEDDSKRVFDPFFTTKGANKGIGLGLSVTRNIISMHRGLIALESRIGEGTKVTVTLKAAKKE